VFTQAKNHWIGTWTQDVAQSTYSPGPGPKSSTHTFQAAGDGFKHIIDTVNAQGQKTHTEVTAKFDGKDYPVIGGAAPNLTRSYRRIDDRTIEVVNKAAGKVTTTIRDAVSSDGKTRTGDSVGTNAQGQPTKSHSIFVRQR
jgi:histidinol dehydrogenase